MTNILEYIKWGLWILFGSGVLFEIAPIKISPISTILGWIGNKLNRDVKKDITELQKNIGCLKSDLQEHKVESQRRDILDFADELIQGQKKTKENFNNIISLHDKYEKYINENGIENGQVDLAFLFISEKYKECQIDNGFL